MTNYPKAIPSDPTELQGYFANDNLSFVSVASLKNFSIRLVLNHPVKLGQKLYYFDDTPEIRELWRQYAQGELLIDPKSLQTKIPIVKNLPISERGSNY